jgi:glutamine synthetase
MLTGRTLFGLAAPKGQELEDQYFGSIKDRVSKFMKEVDIELWKMGITSKTKHNEVAPSQFEMAPIYATTNIAADHNQLVMETMKRVALKNELVCLLYEKPYKGINGSGKHNNWSLITDDGINLLEPGKTPHENEQFLLLLVALLKGINKHADILRAAAGNPGNDHRLGANEAPPAIISIFLGDELTDILEKLSRGEKAAGKDKAYVELGVDTIPPIPKDNTDRNRTSPFAFTGNKFEFRMVGSSASISGPNVALNTIVAQTLDEIATRLEKAANINKEATAIVREFYNENKQVVFNGNNYSEEWVKEAEKRGLPNIRSTIEAYASFITPKAYELFSKYKVLSERELHSRYEIYMEQYVKHINIEALTAIRMANTQYIPAVSKYLGQLAGAYLGVKACGAKVSLMEQRIQTIAGHLEKSDKLTAELSKLDEKANSASSLEEKGKIFKDEVMFKMAELRDTVDELESMVDKEYWPVPTYSELLFVL